MFFTITFSFRVPLTDLLDSILQLVSLEKDDEDRLADLVALHRRHSFDIVREE